MSFIVQVTRSLFPKGALRPARPRRESMTALSQLFALACALTPLAATVHAMHETV